MSHLLLSWPFNPLGLEAINFARKEENEENEGNLILPLITFFRKVGNEVYSKFRNICKQKKNNFEELKSAQEAECKDLEAEYKAKLAKKEEEVQEEIENFEEEFTNKVEDYFEEKKENAYRAAVALTAHIQQFNKSPYTQCLITEI